MPGFRLCPDQKIRVIEIHVNQRTKTMVRRQSNADYAADLTNFCATALNCA